MERLRSRNRRMERLRSRKRMRARHSSPQPEQPGAQQGAPADPKQLPPGMTNEPQCPCPLTTKDPVEPHFQMVCGRCHLPDRIIGIRKSGNEWKETIDKMILK